MKQQHELLEKFITGLSKGYANGLIICSPTGYGKTETTMNMMKKFGYKENQHYIYTTNYITPVELYKLLQKTNELQNPRILILDDIEDTLRNLRAVGLLKGALWSFNDKRKVSWNSATYLIKEKEFEFKGRIIFLLNELNQKSQITRALKDRGFYYEIKLTKSELIDLMEQRAKDEYKGLSYDQRLKVVEFIKKVGVNSKNISLRLLPKAYNLFMLSPNHYQQLIVEQLL